MAPDAKQFKFFRCISLIGLIGMFASILFELGWDSNNGQYAWVTKVEALATLMHLVGVCGFYLTGEKELRPPLRLILFQIICCLGIIGIVIWSDRASGVLIYRGEIIRLSIMALLVLVTGLVSLTHLFQWLIEKRVQAPLTTKSNREGYFSRRFRKRRQALMPPALQFVVSLTGLVLVGSLLLMLPNATYRGISFTDALFTSASAVCVTGLTSVNFTECFTWTGQFFVLCLIQLGGLGVMTFAYFIAMIAGQGISMKDRVLLRNLLDENNLHTTVSSVRSIVIITFLLEGIGATLLYFTWKAQGVNLGDELWWHAIFHAVSAFCNAGFSTFPNGLATSSVSQCYLGQFIITGLIAMGGFGFVLHQEVGKHFIYWCKKHSSKRLQKQPWSPFAKLVLCTSFSLVIGATTILFLTNQSLFDKPWYERLMICYFDSVSGRTAGFNLTDIGLYSPSSCFLLCIIMVIGGSPSGTAGGIRTTTFSIVFGEIIRVIRGQDHVVFFRRRIAPDVVSRCLCTVAMCCLWIGGMTILISTTQTNLPFLTLLFEICSAFSTTGLSMGITGDLQTFPKYLIIINMIVGRTGLFLFLVAMLGKATPKHYSYPTIRIPLT